MTKKPHWTQTPEGKARMAEVQKKAWQTKRAKMRNAAKTIVRKAKKTVPRERKPTTLVINGWRVILGKNEVRVEND
jgi:regulator of sirC expression with transglutaminase-like and TPR domain